MIDTIILIIPNGHLYIREHDRFTPSTEGLSTSGLVTGARLFNKYIQNPDNRIGRYKPRLTVTPRWGNGGIEIDLKIEFSVPKLLYGHNFNEVEEQDFKLVVKILRERLQEIGVYTFETVLREAKVSAIHFCKNILLKDGYTVSLALKELGKLDVSKKLDPAHRHFQNGGHALYFYSASYQLVFYDKMKDATKPKAKAIDKDKTPQQRSLFEYLDATHPELLRYEVRIAKRQKLNADLAKLGYNPNPTFQEIFRKDVAQDILVHYWDKLTSGENSLLLSFDEEPEHLFAQIAVLPQDKKKVSAKKALSLLGATLYLRTHGSRPFRNAIESRYSERTWFRLDRELLKLAQSFKPQNKLGFMGTIEQALDEFEPYRVDSSELVNVNESKVSYDNEP